MINHLYLHSPFCRTICPYCDFHVTGWGEAVVEPYVRRLTAEVASQAADHGGSAPLTIYLGGGTPSLLPLHALERVVTAIDAGWGWPAREATIEANPDDVTPAALAAWRELGFTRVSIGVQSFDDTALRVLGRTHGGRQAQDALTLALESGLEVSADVITSIPLGDGKTFDCRPDLDTLARSGVPHVSAYSLTIEPGTRFHRQGVRVDPDADADAFAAVEDTLAAYGLRRYEVSNHARPGHESLHNLAYWENSHYAGLGPSASGHYPAAPRRPGVLGERRTNPRLRQWLAGEPALAIPLDARELAVECLLMGLRLRRGVDLAGVSDRTGLALTVILARPIDDLARSGLVEMAGSVIRATAAGRWRLDGVTATLIDALRQP